MAKRTNSAVWMENQKRWQINVQKDGIRRSFTSSKAGRTGQREANAKADAWLDSGINHANQRVYQILPEYLEDVKARTSAGNYRNVEYQCRSWIEPQIGRVKLDSLNDQHLQSIINEAHKKGLSKKSLSTLRSTIFNFIKFCRKCKAITFFPEDIIIPNSAYVGHKKILQPDDLAILFSSDRTLYKGKETFDNLIYAYRLQVLTGLRPSELLGLMWSDIKGNTMTIQRALNIRGELTQGKNANARRAVVLTELAQETLKKQKELVPNSLYIFPVREVVYGRHLQRFCEFNNMTVVTPYELRHTFVSIAKSLPEGEVKALVGHSRSMDTFGVYGHTVFGEEQQTANKLSSIFDSILKSVL